MWQKIVLLVVGVWIVYSIMVWVCVKFAFKFGFSMDEVLWITEKLWPYTIQGVFRIKVP
jgi:hypothetical protein